MVEINAFRGELTVVSAQTKTLICIRCLAQFVADADSVTFGRSLTVHTNAGVTISALISNLSQLLLGYFDPVNIIDGKNKSGVTSQCLV